MMHCVFMHNRYVLGYGFSYRVRKPLHMDYVSLRFCYRLLSPAKIRLHACPGCRVPPRALTRGGWVGQRVSVHQASPSALLRQDARAAKLLPAASRRVAYNLAPCGRLARARRAGPAARHQCIAPARLGLEALPQRRQGGDAKPPAIRWGLFSLRLFP